MPISLAYDWLYTRLSGDQRRRLQVKDENGAVWQKVEKIPEPKPEPGRWRVEVVPPAARKRDRFLLVLKPALRGEVNPATVVPWRQGEAIGCRLQGNRPLRLRFPADRPGVLVDLPGESLDLTLRAC